ncbi:hypothetical protein HZS_3201 [Henneguya salminicola]|nr:hypothetical protein HZS_3201 [Henneguya salminicola]
MFYVDFLFSKKSPLNRLWLAAHFEKRLSKNQIYETDIFAAIEEILSPEVRVAIRLSGHLLFGLARIYYQKVCYILDETSLSYIRQMQPAIDKEPRYFESKLHKKIKKRKISIDILRQSRVEDITLRDEPLPIHRIMDETLEESRIPKFEEEVMRSFMGGMEESAFELSKISVPKIGDNDKENYSILIMPCQSSMPPERTFLSENKANISRCVRKRKAQLFDSETVIDKATYKKYLEDATSLMRVQDKGIENAIDWDKILKIPCFYYNIIVSYWYDQSKFGINIRRDI